MTRERLHYKDIYARRAGKQTQAVKSQDLKASSDPWRGERGTMDSLAKAFWADRAGQGKRPTSTGSTERLPLGSEREGAASARIGSASLQLDAKAIFAARRRGVAPTNVFSQSSRASDNASRAKEDTSKSAEPQPSPTSSEEAGDDEKAQAEDAQAQPANVTEEPLDEAQMQAYTRYRMMGGVNRSDAYDRQVAAWSARAAIGRVIGPASGRRPPGC